MQSHIQKEHNNHKKIQTKVFLFPVSNFTLSKDQKSNAPFKSILDIQNDLSASFGGSSSVGSTRRGRSHIPARPTPYERTSRSSSPVQKTSPGSLSPLRISSPHRHLSALSAGPSPLNQIAFSHPNSPISDDKMDIDEDDTSQSDDTSQTDDEILEDDKVLAKGSLAIIPLHHLHTLPATQLIACTKCLHGVFPSAAVSHALEHKINLTRDEKRDIREIIESGHFMGLSNEVKPPPYPCPPIDGLKIQNGLVCNICDYCCPTKQGMVTHFGNEHKGIGGSTNHSESTPIQSYFAQRPKYFRVVPILRGQSKDDLFAVYLRQCAPPIEALMVLNPPLDPNEVPPLLKVTQWHEHLKVYTADREKVRKLLELTTLPTSNRGEAWMGAPLRTTIEGYMKDVRTKANNSSIGIKCLLKECPRSIITPFIFGFDANQVSRTTQNGQHWIPLGDDTLSKYGTLLHQWTHAILLTVDNHDSGYKFPLTEGDIHRAQMLKDALQQSPKRLHIEVFHNFIMPFMYPKIEDRSPGPFTKWDDVFECLFAVSALREDGNFQPANHVTQMFAKMKYFVRCTILYEAMRQNEESHYELVLNLKTLPSTALIHLLI